MAHIRVLSPHVANQIAAGEVVERPASIVKELVENAVDAGATAITIEIENGGIDCIRVIDNGSGIMAEDCENAFLRHATSKISDAEDLSHIASLGFRGEALASIAAVSHVELRTHTKHESEGTLLCIDGGEITQHVPLGCPDGTALEIRGLFYNTPARLRFLKNARTEAGYIGEYIAKMIMALPQLTFHFVNNGKTVYRSAGDGQLKNALVVVYGMSILSHLRAVDYDDGYVRLHGYIGTDEIARPNRSHQSFFLNGRVIRSAALSYAVQRGAETRIMIGKFPFAVLSITISSAEVDVNVHPTKMEVRFVEEGRITRALTASCARALIEQPQHIEEAQENFLKTTQQTIVQTAVPFGSTLAEGSKTVEHLQTHSSNGTNYDSSCSAVADKTHASLQFRGENAAKYEAYLKEGAEYTPVSFHNKIPMFQVSPPNSDPASLLPIGSDYITLQDPDITLIGVAFQTYWIVQRGDDLYYIDQHAAHERKLYEALMTHNIQVVSQPLLFPSVVQLHGAEYEIFIQYETELSKFGYVLEDQGNGSISIHSVPAINGAPLSYTHLLETLEKLRIADITTNDLCRDILIQTACKRAVKAGEKLAPEEIESLLTELQSGKIPLNCPHGRPIAVRITKNDLEKMFKRVL